MAVSKGIAFAPALGSSPCYRVALAFDLGPQLAQWVPGSSKKAPLTLNLGNLACSRDQLAHDMRPHLAPGAMVSEGAQLTLYSEPLAIGAHCLLIGSSCLHHEAPLALDLGPQPAPGAP